MPPAASGLRTGDTFHLGCVEAAGANQIAMLDAMQAHSAAELEIKTLAFA